MKRSPEVTQLLFIGCAAEDCFTSTDGVMLFCLNKTVSARRNVSEFISAPSRSKANWRNYLVGGGFANLRVSQRISRGMEFNSCCPLETTLMDRDQIIHDLTHILCN